jgi:hypothetical protein
MALVPCVLLAAVRRDKCYIVESNTVEEGLEALLRIFQANPSPLVINL